MQDEPGTPRLTSYVWEAIASKEDKERARRLINEVLTGDKRRQALNWLSRTKSGADKLSNFIKNMEAALAARKEEQSESTAGTA